MIYQLSNFSSVFELSAAVFLAYGLIKSAYRFPLEAVESLLQNAKSTWAEFGMDYPDSLLPSAIGLLERTYTLERMELDKFYISMSRLSVSLTIIPLTFLLISGFCDPKLSILNIILVLMFSIAPQPLLVFISWQRSNKVITSLEQKITILKKEVFELLFVSQSKATAKKHNK